MPPSSASVLAISSPTTVSMLAPRIGSARAISPASGIASDTSRRVLTGAVLRPEQEIVERLPDEQRLDLGHDVIVTSTNQAA